MNLYADTSFFVSLYLPDRHSTEARRLHVAAALELGAEHFWTFDERQAKLAAAVGLILT